MCLLGEKLPLIQFSGINSYNTYKFSFLVRVIFIKPSDPTILYLSVVRKGKFRTAGSLGQ